MLPDADSRGFDAESLYFASKTYKDSGFSPIPVLGSCQPQRGKQAAIRWSRYIHARPDDSDLEDWFLRQRFGGVALVCGRVSGLLVLDFDDPALASEFRRLNPDLADTYTVRSGGRGLPHLYWRLPEGMTVLSRSRPGVDLRGEGSYVIAPPTRIGLAVWRVDRDIPIRALRKADLSRIYGFMAVSTPAEPQNGSERPSGAILTASANRTEAAEFRRCALPADLLDYYRRLAPRGRNQALFQVAIDARDSGWTETAVASVLADVHARWLGRPDVREGYQFRFQEAVRTIASAFKRPPRRHDEPSRTGLSTAAREKLLQSGLVSIARVLDALYRLGYAEGALLTERQVCEAVQRFQIGRRTVMAALKSLREAGWMPPGTPHSLADAAAAPEGLDNSCEMSRGADRVKTPGGRPAARHAIPGAAALARCLGVRHAPGDALPDAALTAPAAYRQAVHAGLIARRPAAYGREWLSARVGVSRWTTRRYDRRAGIAAEPLYAAQPVEWASLETLLPSQSREKPGLFLEAADGRRYPPVAGLARRLLARGQRLTLKRRLPNAYQVRSTVGIPTPQALMPPAFGPAWAAMPLASRPPGLPVLQPSGVGIPTLQPGGSPGLSPDSGHHRHSQSLAGIAASRPPDLPVTQPPGVGIPTLQSEPATFWLCPKCLRTHVCARPPELCDRCRAPVDWEAVPEFIWRDLDACKTWWRHLCEEREAAERRGSNPAVRPASAPLADPAAEQVACRAWDSVRDLSRQTARRLVERYGIPLVEKALALLRQRPARNPAGLFISILKSMYKLSNHIIEPPPARSAQTQAGWLAGMAASPYLEFLANAEDVKLAQGAVM